MFWDFLLDQDNYEERKVAYIKPEDNNGIGVSTAYTSDEGYETALLDSGTQQVYPVERYTTREAAIEGHAKWVDFAQIASGKQVVRLGTSGGEVKDKVITLKGMEVMRDE